MQAHDGEKAHEPQFWTPLRFDAHGNVLPFTWVDSFTVDMVLPQPGLRQSIGYAWSLPAVRNSHKSSMSMSLRRYDDAAPPPCGNQPVVAS